MRNCLFRYRKFDMYESEYEPDDMAHAVKTIRANTGPRTNVTFLLYTSVEENTFFICNKTSLNYWYFSPYYNDLNGIIIYHYPFGQQP